MVFKVFIKDVLVEGAIFSEPRCDRLGELVLRVGRAALVCVLEREVIIRAVFFHSARSRHNSESLQAKACVTLSVCVSFVSSQTN